MRVMVRHFPLLLLLPLYGLPAPLLAQAAADSVEARAADPAAMSRELTHRYPQYYEHVGIGGVVRLKAFIDAAGKADSVYVTASSGVAALDRAAANVARTGRYVPASGASGPVGSWTDAELQFGSTPATPAGAHPRVANRDALLHAVQAHIPEDLRRQQIGTAVVVHITVDGGGNVIRTAVPDPAAFPPRRRPPSQRLVTSALSPATAHRRRASPLRRWHSIRTRCASPFSVTARTRRNPLPPRRVQVPRVGRSCGTSPPCSRRFCAAWANCSGRASAANSGCGLL
jgi:TonB family protein